MSNLSKRVEKSKALVFSHNHHSPGEYGTWGSNGKDYGTKYYHVSLSHTSEVMKVKTPDYEKKIKMTVFLVSCQKDTGTGSLCNCPGNERHTVCYHGLGAIYQSFKAKDRLVSFFETYETAKQMAFGGKIAKVKSIEGNGYLWCVIRDWPKAKKVTTLPIVQYEYTYDASKNAKDSFVPSDKILSSQENISLSDFQKKVISKSLEINRVSILTTKENVNLMRGSEDDEGID